MSIFDIAFDRLMGNEGGYSNDPNDPGGETNWGISKRSYPSVNIKELTRDGAKTIYQRDFWDKLDADTFDPALSFQLFDFAVNSGIETAIRYLQRAIDVADDGHWGPHSQEALEKLAHHDVVMLLLAERIDFMRRLKNWKDAGNGWMGRIATNLRYGAKDA